LEQEDIDRFRRDADCESEQNCNRRLQYAREILGEVLVGNTAETALALFIDIQTDGRNVRDYSCKDIGHYNSFMTSFMISAARKFGRNGYVGKVTETGVSWTDFLRKDLERLVHCAYCVSFPKEIEINDDNVK
jgi:hypothetical protein